MLRRDAMTTFIFSRQNKRASLIWAVEGRMSCTYTKILITGQTLKPGCYCKMIYRERHIHRSVRKAKTKAKPQPAWKGQLTWGLGGKKNEKLIKHACVTSHKQGNECKNRPKTTFQRRLAGESAAARSQHHVNASEGHHTSKHDGRRRACARHLLWRGDGNTQLDI